MSAQYDYDLICIGSGPAGQRAAIQAAKLGKRVALIERRQCVGGSFVQTSTIPSKTFREAVRSFSSAITFDDGLGFAPKPKPTMKQLLSRVGQVMQREAEVQQHQLQRNDVNIILGAGSFQDPHHVLVENEQGSRVLSAEHILIAVGSRPVQLPGVQPDGRTIITSDGVVDLEHMPRSVAVVGAGVIGLEYASMFAALGMDVTAIDKRTELLDMLDREIVEELTYQLRRKKVTFRLGEAVESIEVVDHPKRQGLITLQSGKHVVADLVLFSAGRQGATDTLNLENAGLEADERGRLEVDDHFRTAVPHIYAAGDIIGFPALAATSAEQGRLSACCMFGAQCEAMAEHFPIGIYAIPEISMVGATEASLTEQRVPYEVGVARFGDIARGQILGDDTGLFKMIFHRDTHQLLGCHCIGTGATELIHVGQAILRLGGGLEYFLETVFNYPTLAECYKVAALDAANKIAKTRAVSAVAV